MLSGIWGRLLVLHAVLASVLRTIAVKATTPPASVQWLKIKWSEVWLWSNTSLCFCWSLMTYWKFKKTWVKYINCCQYLKRAIADCEAWICRFVPAAELQKTVPLYICMYMSYMLTVRHEYAGLYLRRNCRKLCPCTYVCIWVICWLWGMNMQVCTCGGTVENCAPVHMYVYELYADCEAWICRFVPAAELQKTVPLYICMYMSYMLTVRHEYAGLYLRRNCRKLCPCTYVCIWVICWLWGMNLQVFTCGGTAENCAPVHMYVYELYADCEAWICRFLPAELQKTVPLYICMYMSYMLTLRHEYAGLYLRRNCRKLCPCTYVCIWVICWLWGMNLQVCTCGGTAENCAPVHMYVYELYADCEAWICRFLPAAELQKTVPLYICMYMSYMLTVRHESAGFYLRRNCRKLCPCTYVCIWVICWLWGMNLQVFTCGGTAENCAPVHMYVYELYADCEAWICRFLPAAELQKTVPLYICMYMSYMLTVRHESAGFYLRRNCRKLCPCTYVCIWVICWLWGMNLQVFTCGGTAENCAPVHMYVYELYADCEAWICRFLPAAELQKTVPLYICMYMSYMLTVRHESAGLYLRRNCRKLCPCTYVCIWVICWLWGMNMQVFTCGGTAENCAPVHMYVYELYADCEAWICRFVPAAEL